MPPKPTIQIKSEPSDNNKNKNDFKKEESSSSEKIQNIKRKHEGSEHEDDSSTNTNIIKKKGKIGKSVPKSLRIRSIFFESDSECESSSSHNKLARDKNLNQQKSVEKESEPSRPSPLEQEFLEHSNKKAKSIFSPITPNTNQLFQDSAQDEEISEETDVDKIFIDIVN